MRAVAVGLVLLYHAGLPFIPGGFIGVDIFFVISGFLITQMLVREVEQTGRVSLVRFYARRAKRLLPAAALVLATTAVLTWAFISAIDWRTFGIDIAASAVYLVNWRLADRSVDYLAEDVGASPVQHFWSLAVEEQFYIVWPLLLLLVAWWVRRSGWPVRRAMAGGLALVAIPSFIWSLRLTAASPSVAFFVTTTRMWELAVGAFVAIAAARLARIPKRLAAVCAWAGLALVLIGGLTVSTATPWPGSAALIPVAGTAAVIAFGPAAVSGGPVMLLRLPILQWVGKLSYSLYLWHWPLLIFATAYWEELSIKRGVAITLLSFVPAWIAFTLIENPVRRLPVMSRLPKLALATGAVLTTTGVLAGAALVMAIGISPANQFPTAQPQSRTAQGAAILGDEPTRSPHGIPVDSVDWMTPLPIEATEDMHTAYADGCQTPIDSSTPTVCEYGRTGASTTIALVGDSKILQWSSAFIDIANDEGWRLLTLTKSACPFADAATTLDNGEIYESCVEWNQAALDKLLSLTPDLVITSQGKADALDDLQDPDVSESKEAMAEGLAKRWAVLQDAGIDVVVLSDNPHPGMQVYECVQEHSDSMTACAFDRAEAIEHRSAAPTQRMAVDQSPGVGVIDLTDFVCPSHQCAPVIGNVLVYRQGSHLTDTYIKSLTPRLEKALDEQWFISR